MENVTILGQSRYAVALECDNLNRGHLPSEADEILGGRMAHEQSKVASAQTGSGSETDTDNGGGKTPPKLSMSLEDQKQQLSSPPPIPRAVDGAGASNATPPSLSPSSGDTAEAHSGDPERLPKRRAARRRPAGPVKGTIAANDDAPSIGGLIFALEQKPSNKPFVFAGIASAAWAVAGLSFVAVMLWHEVGNGASLLSLLGQPTTFFSVAAIVIPIAILWFLALLAWRSEELRLRSSTMAEVAVRLAEPDRMAEQSVASLGQAVRRQVAFMNDAVSRALGRAGELEALVHNEVSALENSYEENERKIRGLIQELSGERSALSNTGDRVAGTLRQLGSEVPSLIEKLSHQQIRLAQIIQQAGDNLTTLETSVGANVEKLETSLGGRTEELQTLLEGYTTGLAAALGSRSDQMRDAFDEYLKTLEGSLGTRTEALQTVFVEYAKALDTTLANRAKTLDVQLIERTKALDLAFNERLQRFDDSIRQSTTAIDSAVNERASALTSALDNHAKQFKQEITQQSTELDESLTHGISAVRRTSENITRQSLKAIEGLSGQSELLKNVSENLLGQINAVTGRFENQSQSIMKAANSLEAANYKIDVTLKARHSDLSQTLEDLTGKADEFGQFVKGYSSTIEGSLSEAESRARAAASENLLGGGLSGKHGRSLTEPDPASGKLKEHDLRELQLEYAKVGNAVDRQLGGLRTQFATAPDDVRKRAGDMAREIASEQQRLRETVQNITHASRGDVDDLRSAMRTQMRAVEKLDQLAQQNFSAPASQHQHARPAPSSLTQAYEGSTPGRALSSGGHQDATSGNAFQGGRAPAPSARATERDTWSFGDLLARASEDERRAAPEPAPTEGGFADDFKLNIKAMANALNSSTAASIWARLRTGQSDVMSRAFYNRDGQVLFDQFVDRLRTDPGLQQTVDRFLSDFERIRSETEVNDPSGQQVQNQLLSETGRVYLFLAHARGRIR